MINNGPLNYSTTANNLGSFYTITTNGTGGLGNIGTSFGSNGTYWSTTSTPSNGLHVKGDAEFEGDVTIQGHSILHTLKKIEDRLAILQDPDPEKLEKFAALKKAYDHYLLMEKLVQE